MKLVLQIEVSSVDEAHRVLSLLAPSTEVTTCSGSTEPAVVVVDTAPPVVEDTAPPVVVVTKKGTPRKAPDPIVVQLEAGDFAGAMSDPLGLFKVFVAMRKACSKEDAAAVAAAIDQLKASDSCWWLLPQSAQKGEIVMLHPVKDPVAAVAATYRALTAKAPVEAKVEAPVEAKVEAPVRREEKKVQFVTWLTGPNQPKDLSDRARVVLTRRKYTAALARAASDPGLTYLGDLTDAQWDEVYAEINAEAKP